MRLELSNDFLREAAVPLSRASAVGRHMRGTRTRAAILSVPALSSAPRHCGVARVLPVCVPMALFRRPAGTRRGGRRRHAAAVCLRAGALRAWPTSGYVSEQACVCPRPAEIRPGAEADPAQRLE